MSTTIRHRSTFPTTSAGAPSGATARTSETVTALATPPLPDELPRSHGSSGKSSRAFWVGAATLGVASVGAILGTMSPGTNAPVAGVPISTGDIRLDAPKGTQISTMRDALGKAFDVLGPLGLSHENALESMDYISISAELPSGLHQRVSEKSTLELAPNARLSVSLDNYGLRLSAHPGLDRVVDWGFDTKIESIRYDFSDAKVDVDASGFGLDSWHTDGVRSAIESKYVARLPEVMRKGGYIPKSDPQLTENLQSIIDMLAPKSATGSSGLSATGSSLAAPELNLSFRVPADKTTKLADGPSVNVKAGTQVTVSVRMEGPVSKPTLGSIQVHFSEPVVISESGSRTALGRMDLNGFTIRPGPQVTLDYDLGPEGLIDGLKALLVLTASAADPQVAARMSDVHISKTELTGPRKDIQDKVDNQIEPKLAELVRKNDAAVPGLSLKTVFGVQ